MPRSRPPSRRPGYAARAGLLLAVAALALAGCTGASGKSATDARETATAPASVAPSSSSSPARPEVAPTEQPIRQARRTGSVAPEPPRSVRLPSGRRVPVQAVSSAADGRLDVPTDIDHAGWFRGGSALGDPFGSTLLAAHVDSITQGLGPFQELLSVREGQRVTVSGRSLEQTFRVDSLRLIPQGSLADDRWIYAPSGKRRLTLVTCAPPFVRDRGGYQNLAVVTALPIGDPRVRKD